VKLPRPTVRQPLPPLSTTENPLPRPPKGEALVPAAAVANQAPARSRKVLLNT
jgi:hypothetical protein